MTTLTVRKLSLWMLRYAHTPFDSEDAMEEMLVTPQRMV